MYKGILLDIDNTLYQYEPLHEQAQEAVFNFVANEFDIQPSTIASAFKKAKLYVKQNTPETASSHNRLLYMQNLCELLKLDSLSYSMTLYNLYWDTFLEQLQLTKGAQHFFNKFGNLPICLVTDLTAHIQHRKVSKLKLNRWANFMVTSEEAGCEKPHPFMFQLALHKLGLQSHEVCMVGDSFKKDIQGAQRLGIHAFWLCPTTQHIQEDGITCISDLEEIQW